uniref:SUZ domain-containing protein 1-like n=1 Tax=Phallusia mammillata TaxID=59560 RepID=A0A6F9DUU0_9ASCI|nr:SUZ domain-containing protein 1-like [Phallusia mammillata]
MAEEGIWDSWEDFADCGDLDKHVDEDLNMQSRSYTKNNKEKTKSVKQNHTDQNNTIAPGGIRILQRPVVVHEEDQNRTAYVPQLKILKRPEKSLTQQQREEEERKRQMAQNPVRSLAQREAAYAEARQRIMGENMAQENNGKHSNSSSDARPENLKRFSKTKQSHQNGHGGDVKRQPKGPNSNSRGFKTNR